MIRRIMCAVCLALIFSLDSYGAGQAADMTDPAGVLRKPIPDKLVVLTFDDGCASGYTVIAPLLNRLGFGGSFYICDFDSFKTRKDWYLTWAQMRALDASGFEIGNHTRGHAGGSGINPYLAMQNDLLANHVPKPTTIAWPMYQVNTKTFGPLTENGYFFGRGGHQRPYRPTVDNPFDIPSLSVGSRSTVAGFVNKVRRSVDGRIVVLTFHGVPDMEHSICSVEPAAFELMMQYLKDNHYKAIAMRDLADYIDPAKAAKLEPTARNVKVEDSRLASEEVPWIPKDIVAISFPGLPPPNVASSRISVNVPYSADVTALVPEITISEDATVTPPSGAAVDFTKPQKYTVTGKDGSHKVYTVAVERKPASAARRIETFTVPGQTAVAVSDDSIAVYVPKGTNLAKIAPTFTLSPFATADIPAGAPRDFTQPQVYRITAQNGSSHIYTVKVIECSGPNAFTWIGAKAGEWSDAANWTDNLGSGSAPLAAGQPNYLLLFDKQGKYSVESDLQDAFALNQLSFLKANVELNGKSLQFAKAFGMPPRLIASGRSNVKIATPISLADALTVDVAAKVFVTVTGNFVGKGSLIKTGRGRLWIGSRINTFEGGTVINEGTLTLMGMDEGFGSGPITLNGDARLHLERVSATNDLILNGGIVDGANGFGCDWNGTIILNGNAQISSFADFRFNAVSGGISGPGSFTQIGKMGGFNRKGGTITLYGTNTYTGPTAVTQESVLKIMKTSALYNGDTTQWTAAKIKVMNASTLQLAVGGEDQFTAAQIDTLISQLSKSVDNNGLMMGAILALDTSKATSHVRLQGNFSNSKGPGGGGYSLKKVGKGTLALANKSTFTGPTLVEEGTLSLPKANALGKTDVYVAKGAILELNFDGKLQIGQLYLDGKLQSSGSYNAENAGPFIKGTGVVVCQEEEVAPLNYVY